MKSWLAALLLVGCDASSNHNQLNLDLAGNNELPDLAINPEADLATLDDRDGFQPPPIDLTVPQQVMYGLNSRPANPTCLAPPRPPVVPTGDYTLDPVFPNLKTGNDPVMGGNSPIAARRVRMPTTQADGAHPGKVLPGPYTWVLGLRNGKVFVADDPTAAAPPAINLLDPYLNGDLTASEGGFMAFEFDPDIGTDPARAYIYYVEGEYGQQQLFRAHVDVAQSGGGFVYTTSSPTLIMQAASDFEHHDGDVHFGPDGFLYWSTGDGAKETIARSTKNLRGKILRIDVHSTALTANYGIPSDNPYRLNGASPNPACMESGADPADSATNCPEIWAVGLRNPFRFNFDRQGGAMMIGDVASFDEINLGALGADYGWNAQNGTSSGDPAITSAIALLPDDGCDAKGTAVVSGYVYRGTAIPSLVGKYLFANWGGGELYVMDNPYDSSRSSKRVYNDTCTVTDFFPGSFAEDEDGELYVVSLNPATGKGLFHIVPKSAETPPDGGVGPALLLSQTGCFEAGVPVTPKAGAIPYEVNMELWSDGLYKRRWMALPDGTSITVETNGDWTLPVGTVLIKEFSSPQKLIETRMLVRHADGDWAGYTWVWNANQTDAILAATGSSVDPGDHAAAWKIPSRAECLGCHTPGKGRSLGLETRQMNRVHVYPGALAANQLPTLAHIGLLPASYDDASTHPAFPQIDDNSASVESRVRSYLHANCSHCHPGPGAKPDLIYDTTLALSHLCEAPTNGVPGGTLLLAPGDPAHSILDIRMKNLGQYRMPRLGSSRVDNRAIPLVESWITGLSTCP